MQNKMMIFGAAALLASVSSGTLFAQALTGPGKTTAPTVTSTATDATTGAAAPASPGHSSAASAAGSATGTTGTGSNPAVNPPDLEPGGQPLAPNAPQNPASSSHR
jgi:hypothetical protein